MNLLGAEKLSCNGDITVLLFMANNVMAREKVIQLVIALFTEDSKSVILLHESFFFF